MNLNEFLLNDQEVPLFPGIFPVEPFNLTHSFSDITTLNSQLENLSIEVHTKSIWIEVERVKHQKMHSSLKQLKREIVSPHLILIQLRQETSSVQDNQNASSLYLEGELIRQSTLSFRCFSRMHEILISTILYTPIPSNTHTELSQLENELLRTMQQFQVFSEARNVYEIL